VKTSGHGLIHAVLVNAKCHFTSALIRSVGTEADVPRLLNAWTRKTHGDLRLLEFSQGIPGLHEVPPSTRWMEAVEGCTSSQPGVPLLLFPASRHRMPLSVLKNNVWL
jgi:hypothetical protein